MYTLIQALGDQLRQMGASPVQTTDASLLATLPLEGERRQTVKVTSMADLSENFSRLQILSRAAIINDPRLIRWALSKNQHLDCGGFTVDLNSQPPALDIVQSLPLDESSELDNAAIIQAIIDLAQYADSLELQWFQSDHF